MIEEKYKITSEKRKELTRFLKNYDLMYNAYDMNMRAMVRFIKRRLKLKFDCWIGVHGGTGKGKTQTALMATALLGRCFNLKDNVAYVPDGEEISTKFDKLKGGELLIDEAAESMRSFNWQNRDSQTVNTRGMTDRFLGNTVWLNMPDYDEFQASTRRVLQFRIYIPFRDDGGARVILHGKLEGGIAKDKWGESEMDKLFRTIIQRKKGCKILSKHEILSLNRSVPTYIMDFQVPALEWALPEYVQAYEELKLKSRENRSKESTKLGKKEQKYFDGLRNAFMLDYGKSDKGRTVCGELAKKFKIHERTARSWAKEYRDSNKLESESVEI